MAIQREIFELLAEHERKVAELYHLYAEAFAEDGAFWSDLAQQEEGHAAALLSLAARIDQGEAFLRPNRFSIEAVRTSLGCLEEQLQAARAGRASPVEALSAAMDIEEALIERKFYEVARGDSPILQGVLQKLTTETNRHSQRLKERWEAARKAR